MVRPLRAPLLVLACCCAAGCVTLDDDSWSFPATRAVLAELDASPTEARVERWEQRAEGGGIALAEDGAGWVLLGFVLLPLAVDVVLLPVTLTCDALVACSW